MAARPNSAATDHGFPRTQNHLLPLHVQLGLIFRWQSHLGQLLAKILDIQRIWFHRTDAPKNIVKNSVALSNAG